MTPHPRVLEPLDEVPGALPAQASGVHAGFAIALAAEEAAQMGDAANHVPRTWRGIRHRLLRQNVGHLPLRGREQQGRIQIRMDSPQTDHPLQTPGHHNGDRTGQFDLANGPRLQCLDPTAVLQPIEEHLDFPVRPILVDQLRSGFKTDGLPMWGSNRHSTGATPWGRFACHQARYSGCFFFMGPRGWSTLPRGVGGLPVLAEVPEKSRCSLALNSLARPKKACDF